MNLTSEMYALLIISNVCNSERNTECPGKAFYCGFTICKDVYDFDFDVFQVSLR